MAAAFNSAFLEAFNSQDPRQVFTLELFPKCFRAANGGGYGCPWPSASSCAAMRSIVRLDIALLRLQGGTVSQVGTWTRKIMRVLIGKPEHLEELERALGWVRFDLTFLSFYLFVT